MKVTRLSIEENPTYASVNPGKMVAKVKYESPEGEVILLLDSDVSIKLLEICAQLVADYSRMAAEKMAKAILDRVEAARQLPVEVETAA